DVRTLQPHRGARFSFEALDRLRIAGGRAVEHLDRDLLFALEIERAEDDAHASLAEGALHAVTPRKDGTREESRIGERIVQIEAPCLGKGIPERGGRRSLLQILFGMYANDAKVRGERFERFDDVELNLELLWIDGATARERRAIARRSK